MIYACIEQKDKQWFSNLINQLYHVIRGKTSRADRYGKYEMIDGKRGRLVK